MLADPAVTDVLVKSRGANAINAARELVAEIKRATDAGEIARRSATLSAV